MRDYHQNGELPTSFDEVSRLLQTFQTNGVSPMLQLEKITTLLKLAEKMDERTVQLLHSCQRGLQVIISSEKARVREYSDPKLNRLLHQVVITRRRVC